jgi:hypothetical protein
MSMTWRQRKCPATGTAMQNLLPEQRWKQGARYCQKNQHDGNHRRGFGNGDMTALKPGFRQGYFL